MDKEVYIKEELEAMEEVLDIKGETKWPTETRFAEVKEANSCLIEESKNVPLTSQPSWKRDIDDDDDDDDEEVNEEFEQKFVCGFPSNAAEKSSDVEELISKESNPLLIDESLHQTSINQSFPTENLTGLQSQLIQESSPACNSLKNENSRLTNQNPVEMKSLYRRCPVCKEFLNSVTDVKNHSLDHGELWPYNCRKCNRVFIHGSSYRSHMFKQHGVNRSYSCHVCNMTFKEVLELHNHKFIHTRKRAFSCSICNKAFTRNYDCLLHMKKLHKVLRPYRCCTCNETFRLRWDLDRHMSEHGKEKPEDRKFSCDICGRSFTLRGRLISHLECHSNDRPYSCTISNKSFKSKRILSAHTIWHTGERRCTCATCGKVFSTPFWLKKHMLLHSEDRQNVCELCGKSYRRNFYLKQHKLQHEKDLPSFASI